MLSNLAGEVKLWKLSHQLRGNTKDNNKTQHSIFVLVTKTELPIDGCKFSVAKQIRCLRNHFIIAIRWLGLVLKFENTTWYVHPVCQTTLLNSHFDKVGAHREKQGAWSMPIYGMLYHLDGAKFTNSYCWMADAYRTITLHLLHLPDTDKVFITAGCTSSNIEPTNHNNLPSVLRKVSLTELTDSQ